MSSQEEKNIYFTVAIHVFKVYFNNMTSIKEITYIDQNTIKLNLSVIGKLIFVFWEQIYFIEIKSVNVLN